MLLLLATAVAACSGSEPVSREDQQVLAFADLRAAVEETVVDDDRRAEVIVMIDAFESDVNELRALLVRRRAEARALNANYDTTREELIEFSGAMEKRILANRRQVLDSRQKLIQATTAGEWDALAKAETKAMKAIARSVQGI